MALTLSRLIADIEREQDQAEERSRRRRLRQTLVRQSSAAARRDLAADRTARRAG